MNEIFSPIILQESSRRISAGFPNGSRLASESYLRIPLPLVLSFSQLCEDIFGIFAKLSQNKIRGFLTVVVFCSLLVVIDMAEVGLIFNIKIVS